MILTLTVAALYERRLFFGGHRPPLQFARRIWQRWYNAPMRVYVSRLSVWPASLFSRSG